MKSITLHKLDPRLAEELQRSARSQGRSLNQTAQELLRMALGLDPGGRVDRTEAFKDLCGTWTREDLRDFEEGIADLERVDPTDWNG